MALDLVDEQTPPDAIAKLRHAGARVTKHLDQSELQLASAAKAIEYYRDAHDDLSLSGAQIVAGNALYNLGRTAEGRAILEEALNAARAALRRSAVSGMRSPWRYETSPPERARFFQTDPGFAFIFYRRSRLVRTHTMVPG